MQQHLDCVWPEWIRNMISMIRNKPSQKGCYNYWTSLCGVINLFSRNQLAWSSEPQAGSQSDMWSNVRSFTEVSSVLWYALAGHLSKHKCRSCTLAQISNQCRRVWHDWRLVWVIQKPRISWGFCTPPSLGFERNGLKKRTFPVSESRPVDTRGQRSQRWQGGNSHS